MSLLFVYGTLMRGGIRHHLLVDQRFLGVALTPPEFALHDLGAYPGMIHRPLAGFSVHGELYEIDDSRLPRLDEEEGVPDLYGREEIELADLTKPVWTYLYRGTVHDTTLIPTGRWRHGGR